MGYSFFVGCCNCVGFNCAFCGFCLSCFHCLLFPSPVVGWIWFPSVHFGGFGNEKNRRCGSAVGFVGLVGFLGEEGGLWDFRPIVAHFTQDACIVIDQNEFFSEIFLRFCRFWLLRLAFRLTGSRSELLFKLF